MVERVKAWWHRWGLAIGSSLADQATVAATHFLLQIVLARLLPPATYGAFAIAHTGLLFVMGVHTALLSEPVSVLGPARHARNLGGYLTVVLRLHWGLGVLAALLGLLTAGVMLILGSSLVATLVAMALATPFVLLFLLLRRACYVAENARLALIGSLVYAALLGVGLLVTIRLGWLSPWAAFALLGLASLGSALLLAGLLRPALPRVSDADTAGPLWRPVSAEHWRYGRWILAANAAFWVGNGAFPLLVGFTAGLDAAGTFRAFQNLIAPVQQLLAATGLLFLPHLAGRGARDDDPRGPRQRLGKLWALTLPSATLYALAITLTARPLMDLVYDQEVYTGQAGLMPLFALTAVITAVAHGLALGLRALARPQAVFLSKLAGAATTLVVGVALIWRWGLGGAAVALVASVLFEALVLVALFPWKGASP